MTDAVAVYLYFYNTDLFFSSRSSLFRDASSDRFCGLDMALPVVAMTTPCGSAPDVAIWYACTVPDMSGKLNNIENK